MLTQNRYEDFTKYETDLVRSATRRMVGKFGLSKNDIHDLEQELMCHVWLKRGEYENTHDSGSSYETFIANVVEKKSVDILRERGREKRIANCTTTAFTTCGDGSENMDCGYEYIQTAQATTDSLSPDSSVSPENAVLAKITLEETVSSLTCQQNKVFRLVASGYSIIEIAYILSLSESTVYEHIGNICSKLKNAGVLNPTE